jgi:DNA invertase Pin-like site-specific DNA recombinase
VGAYLGSTGRLVADFVEEGSNALARRPMLRAALASCKKHSATLLIAKLGRLARNVHFVSGLLEAGCDFVAADMPQATKTMIHIFAAMSEWERADQRAHQSCARRRESSWSKTRCHRPREPKAKHRSPASGSE